MKCISTVDAVGHILCHDLTQIIPGKFKGARFQKGHMVTKEDIPVLLSMGKENLYVWEKNPGMLHEDEGARRLLELCQNEHMYATKVKEGKIELIADCDGLFQVNVERLAAVNSQEDVMIATRHTNMAVRKGEKLAGMRVIPLIVEEEKLELAKKAAGSEPLISLKPWKLHTCGLITTGNEVAKGLIEDSFTPVIIKKLESYGIQVTEHCLPGDDRTAITSAITEFHDKGVDMILCTGGMSVDPDDKTPGAIKDAGVDIISYGAPVLPGAMFLLSYFQDGTPVMGLPGCVMYAKATVFDLLLPRIAAGVSISRNELKRLGHGGLCLGCAECHYPNCSFGKGE